MYGKLQQHLQNELNTIEENGLYNRHTLKLFKPLKML